MLPETSRITIRLVSTGPTPAVTVPPPTTGESSSTATVKDCALLVWAPSLTVAEKPRFSTSSTPGLPPVA